MSEQTNKTLNIKKICLLSVGVALILFGRFMVEYLASVCFINGWITGSAFVAVMTNVFALSWLVRGVGIFAVFAVGLTTRFRVDTSVLKHPSRSFKKVSTIGVLVLGCLMLCSVVEAPLVQANYVNTISEGYKVAISMSYYDWWVGQLSNGLYFAVNGS